LTYTEKPEIGIMIRHLSPKSKLFSDNVTKTTVRFRWELGEILQKPP